MNTWGISVSAGNAATLTTDFKALFEIASLYRKARETADHHREFSFLNQQDAKDRKTDTRVFCDSLQVLLGKVRPNGLVRSCPGRSAHGVGGTSGLVWPSQLAAPVSHDDE